MENSAAPGDALNFQRDSHHEMDYGAAGTRVQIFLSEVAVKPFCTCMNQARCM